MSDQIAAERRPSPRADQPWPDMEALRSSVTELEQHARTRITQRPVVAVMMAVGVGYLVARLVARGAR